MFASTLGWIATCIVVSVLSIIVGAMPDHNAYPLFFFGIWGVFGSLYAFARRRSQREGDAGVLINDILWDDLLFYSIIFICDK